MDVILDANILLSDVRFEKPGFEDLFDYLKRTGHHLVIPEIVFQEVLARHKDKLSELFEKAKSMSASVREWQLSNGVRLSPIDIEAESKALFERLNQPTKWVSAIRYGKDSDMRAMDVAMRGVHRMKPASAAGEQLRDVLLWLLVLRYARETTVGVAFITRNKKDFCNPQNQSELHSDLVEDSNKLGVKINFYPEITDFIRDQSLEQSPFAESQLPQELSFQNLESKLAVHVANSRTGRGYPAESRITEITYRNGTLFKISDAVSVAELTYDGQVLCKFVEPLYRDLLVLDSRTKAENLARFFAVRPPALYDDYPIEQETEMAEQILRFQATVSVRFRSGQLVSWDVESFKLFEK